MGAWDTPPSQEEIAGAWDTPPTPAEMGKPSRIYTGAEERAAEDRKIAESGGGYGSDLVRILSKVRGLAPITDQAIAPGLAQGLQALGLKPGDITNQAISLADRGLTGVGHGMYNVHLNLSDLLSRIPGNSGAAVDPRAWQDSEQLYARMLGNDTAAGVGNLTGQTAMLGPIAAAGGAVAAPALAAALPASAAPAIPALTLGAEGAAQGFVGAGPGNRAEGALTGLEFGLGTGAAGALLSKAAAKAQAGQDKLRAGAIAKAQEAQDAIERSARGELGSAVQKGSRFEEQFRNYAEDPNIPEDLRAALRAWRGSEQSKELVSSVLRNQLGEAPAIAGTIAEKRTALDALQAGREDAVRAGADAALSFGEAKRQALQRAIRYGLPAVAGMVGGPAGLAEGAVLRPMLHSGKRFFSNPAVLNLALRGVGGTADTLGRFAQLAALGEGPAISAATPRTSEMTLPALAGINPAPSPVQLADLLQRSREGR